MTSKFSLFRNLHTITVFLMMVLFGIIACADYNDYSELPPIKDSTPVDKRFKGYTKKGWQFLYYAPMNPEDYDNAEKAFMLALKKDRVKAYAYYGLSFIYSKKGGVDEAVEMMEKAYAEKPDDNGIVRHLALAYSQKGIQTKDNKMLEDAYKLFKQIADANPVNVKYGSAQVDLAAVLFHLGRYEEGKKKLLKARELEASIPGILIDQYNEKLPDSEKFKTSKKINLALNDIAIGNNTRVAVGKTRPKKSGLIVTSKNGGPWKAQFSDNWPILNGVSYGKGIFVATGEEGIILTSTDGEIWTRRDSGVKGSIYEAVFGNGLFIAFEMSQYDHTVYSEDGITWIAESQKGKKNTLLIHYVWDGKQFVSQDLSGNFTRSFDGKTWEPLPYPGLKSTRGIFFVNEGYFMLDHYSAIYHSTDGIKWEQVHLDTKRDAPLDSIAFGNGRYISVGMEETILSSEDGIHWKRIPSGFPKGWSAFADIVFDEENKEFILVSFYGHHPILTSRDGTKWVAQEIEFQ